jgi:hypothetical protein
MSSSQHPALKRICEEHGSESLDLLADGLSGADVSTVLLEVARRRAEKRRPSEVLTQYERDRFVRPSTVDGRRMIETEALAIASIEDHFDVITLSPLSPLGTHSVVAGVHQHRVVSTVRGSEVAADPTNGLTLEAAVRRRDHLRTPRSLGDVVRLATVQRVTRAQRFEGPMSFAHFSLLGMVIAGRDTGASSFERSSLVSLLRSMSNVVHAVGADEVVVAITDFDGGSGRLVNEVASEFSGPGIRLVIDPHRTPGRGYYPSVCFKLHATFGADEIEVGDGGFVPWTQHLLSNSKERLLIGGIGLDRLAISRST